MSPINVYYPPLDCFFRYGEAVVYLEMLREHHPSHVNGLCQLATCHMQLGHRDKAKELFQLVLSANPNNTMALQNYGEPG